MNFESARGFGQKLIRESSAAVVREAEQAGAATPHEFAEMFFRKANIEAVYDQAENPELPSMRKKLNHRAGLLIANHPGGMDVPVVLSLIERTDIKALASGQGADAVASALGQDIFIRRSADPGELRKQVEDIKAHIAKGGLFILFPTGGMEADGPFEFGGMFRHLVERVLKPEDMIYTCWVAPEDVDRKSSFSRGAGILAEQAVGIKINEHLAKQRVHIDEHYTEALEWQKALQAAETSADKRAVLTEHFLTLFHKESPAQSQ